MVVAATATTATLTGHGAIHTSTLLRESTTTRFCIGWASLPFACKNHEKSGALMCSSSKIRASSTTPIKAVAKEAQLASTEIDQKRRTKYHYLVANAKFMLDEEEHLNELMCERLRNYGERNKEVDFWLVIEPKFLDKFPDVTKRLRRPAVALVSTNGTWITPRDSQSLVQHMGVHHCPPSTFPLSPSIEIATIEVLLEQVVQPSAPSTSEFPSRDDIFTGGITERLGSRRRVTPS